MDRHSIDRRCFLEMAGSGALAASLTQVSVAGRTQGKPNIVLILVDDLGYGELSSYGAGDMRTPNIDRLMASGMRLDNFYANCPVCSPTRAALLTGCYPDLVGVPGVIRTHEDDNFGYLSEDADLLPSVLKKAGYHSALVGKWHLGLESPNTPLDRGFDFFHGFLGDMMDDYYTHLRHDINYMRKNREVIEPNGHATDLFSEWSVDYINDRAGKENPFFLYLAYNAPHTPVQPPEEWLLKVKQREPGIEEDRARLVALIEHLDQGIGRVLDSLGKNGITEETLVVFTSDNGGLLRVGASNGSLRGGKQNMYEGGIRVPACVSWPGKIVPGRDSSSIGLTMDLFPTICDIAGISAASGSINGISLVPAVLEGSCMEDKRLLFWMRREGNRYGGRVYYAARYGDFKLLHNSPFEPMQLFDLGEDPGELRPLDMEHRMYGQLFSSLQKHIQKSGAVPWQEK
ncbi:MAG: sulfatase-like hydrolase/transferase [Acidobacteriota bacterium]